MYGYAPVNGLTRPRSCTPLVLLTGSTVHYTLQCFSLVRMVYGPIILVYYPTWCTVKWFYVFVLYG